MSEKDKEKDLKVNVHETIVVSDYVDAEVIKVSLCSIYQKQLFENLSWRVLQHHHLIRNRF